MTVKMAKLGTVRTGSVVITLSMILAVVVILFSGQSSTLTLSMLLIAATLSHAAVLVSLRSVIENNTDPAGATRNRLLLVGVALWSISLLTRGLQWAGVDRAALLMVPSAAEFLSLAGGLAVMGALMWLPLNRSRRFGRLRTLLDFAILTTSIITLTWLILLEPPITLQMIDLPEALWLGAGPMVDVALLAILIQLWLTNSLPGPRMRNSGLTAWIILRLIADLAHGFLYLQDQPAVSLAPGLAWYVSGASLWGAITIKPLGGDGSDADPAHRPAFGARLGANMSAFLAYIVAGFLVLDRSISGTFDPIAVGGTVVLLILMLARQGVIAGQAEMRQYASLVDSAADLAFVLDQGGAFVLVNPALKNATGADLIGDKTVFQQILADHGQGARIIQQAIESGWAGETQFAGGGGERIPVYLSLVPVLDERRDEPVLAGTAHDLSEVNQRQSELEAALAQVDRARAELQEMNLSLERKVSERTIELEGLVRHLETLNKELQQLDQLKSEFVTLVSHELRAPLTNIRSGLELALRRESRNLSADGAETLRIVAEETERLTGFVETILDLSALEAGRFPLKIQPVDPEVLLPVVRNRFTAEDSRRILFVKQEAYPTLRADESALASVLFHLLDNAVKYAPDSPIEVEISNESGMGCLRVTDHGPGIPAADREAVFERFHRLDHSDAREVYGHGLGLYLCRRLAEAMAGTLEIAQDHQGGARLVLRLPLADQPGGSGSDRAVAETGRPGRAPGG